MTFFSAKKLRQSTAYKVFSVLPPQDQKKIAAATFIQICLGFLDLLGVAALGVVGAISVSGIQSTKPGTTVTFILETLGLAKFSFQSQVACLAAGAGFLMITRTILSMLITRRIYYFLSRRNALLTSSLFSRYISQSLLVVQGKPTHEVIYSLTVGVSSLILTVIGTFTVLIADLSLTLIVFVGLLVVDPLIALQTLVFFGALGYILYKITSVRAHELGYLDSKLTVSSNNLISEALNSYRECVVRNRRSYYNDELKRIRFRISDIAAEMQFMPNVSKYVIESGMIIGAIVIAGTQFALQDSRQAVAALSVFLAAASRIAPAIMRIQQNAIQIRRGIGSASPSLSLIESLENICEISSEIDSVDRSHTGFEPKIEVNSVCLKYPNSLEFALIDVNLEVDAGNTVAIVGPSGAGKTTLVDVILGVIPSTSGTVRISGLDPMEAIARWPGAIAYVPQNVFIFDGTVRANIALGFPAETATDASIWHALEVAQLSDFVRNLPGGIDEHIGESGVKFSGGQRQRLGIARAMFTHPKLIILDEATSSLDGQTESEISSALAQLSGSVTFLIIAHRLSTIREATQVVYMDRGSVVARGTFSEVRTQVSDFENQAQLMGL